MKDVLISGSKRVDDVREIIYRYFKNSVVKVEEKNFESGYEFKFTAKDFDPLGEIALINSFSAIIYNVIDTVYLEDIISRVYKRVYGKKADLDKKDVIYLSTKVLRSDIVYKREKRQIKESICSYIGECENINVDGFIHFRMKNFSGVVEETLKNVVRELENKKKYDEFILTLKYFIDIQTPKYDYLDIIINQDGYKILDEFGEEIEDEGVGDFEISFESHEDTSKVDLLLSSLIVLAPKTFTVHLKYGEEGDLLDVLKIIFQDRVRICNGCNRCGL